ncbi:MAG: nucleoid-associated protein [Methylovulum miyakonense]|uniref:nucleoid-associated protein n=1 Tax=Methylovulum miyakonense TaxID=645578 RepID=UPI003BB5A90F
MSLLTEEEKNALSIRRMIFHVVGKSLVEPTLLEEITPPEHTDFFLERVKSALRGNLFEFKQKSNTEQILRLIAKNRDVFTEQTQELSREFQRLHSGTTSMGVFFVFELDVGEDKTIYALIKYDNEDVVRYLFKKTNGSQVLKLKRSSKNFVRKAEAMQKVALIRLAENDGGQVVVRDRSKPTHISDYFDGFLEVRRVNSPEEMSEKLVEAFKQTFKDHKQSLPSDIQKGGVNRIYEVMRQGGHHFDPENPEPLITAIFGQVDENKSIRKALFRNLKAQGIAEETFEIDPVRVPKPTRHRMKTVEGTQIIYDEKHKPTTRDLPDGRKEIVIVTAKITEDDVDTEKNPRGN